MNVYNALQMKAGAKVEYNKMGTLNQPIQFIPRSKKDNDWTAWNLDWLEWKGLQHVRRNARRLMKNYKLAKGIIDKGDYIIEEDNEYADLIEVLTKEDASALELKFYPIIPNVINTLVSEFAKRASAVSYRAVDDLSYNELLESKRQQVEQALVYDAERKLMMRLAEDGVDIESPEYQQATSPEAIRQLPEIQSFFDKTYRSLSEQWASHQHAVDVERFKMDELEERAFRDMLITDREFWHFRMLDDDYDVELWNPVLTFYHKSPDARYISQGQWVGKFDMMTVADVIDRYGWLMTEEQMETLELIYMGMTNLLRVTTVYWKSQRKVGHLTKIDDYGNVVTDIVDESYSVTDKPLYNTDLFKNKSKQNLLFGEHIDWIWINEVWGGVKIGPNHPTYWGTNNPGGINPIYLGINNNNISPLKFQFKGDDTIYGCKLPVEGSVFSDRNTRSTSLVDLMKPFQIGYNIVNNQIADILVDELGTVILLDQNALPRHSLGEDWGKNNLAKAYVAMKNFQMLPLDTSITNTENALAFQHYQKLDLEQTNRLMSRINLAGYFKNQAFEVIGITPQRMGQQISQQTATGVEQSVNASYAQTEVYFMQHSDYLMPRVHQMRTDLAQFYQSTKPSVRLQYITTTEQRKNFEINGTELLLRDLNIFCTTKANHRAIVEQLKQLAINNNTTGASIYDLGNLMMAESLPDVHQVLKQTENKQQQMRQEEMQQQQQMQEQQLQAQAEEARLKREFEAEQNDLNRQTRLQEARIRSAGFGATVDINQNQQSDYMDALTQINKMGIENENITLQKEKEVNRMAENREKMNIEQQKINTQKDIANTQLQIARENKNKYDKKSNEKKKK